MSNYFELSKIIGYEGESGKFFWLCDLGKKIKKGSVAGSVGGGKKKYIRISYKGKSYLAHRLAHVIVNGFEPDRDMDVDHLNGDSLDNRWSNIKQLKTRSGNLKNIQTPAKSNTGVRGISIVSCGGYKRFDVSIWDGGKRVSRKKFKDFFEACCFRFSEMNKFGYEISIDI